MGSHHFDISKIPKYPHRGFLSGLGKLDRLSSSAPVCCGTALALSPAIKDRVSVDKTKIGFSKVTIFASVTTKPSRVDSQNRLLPEESFSFHRQEESNAGIEIFDTRAFNHQRSFRTSRGKVMREKMS